MDIETLIETLAECDLLHDAATIVDEYWEDDYAEAAADAASEGGRTDYSILDFAADVVRDASENDLEAIEKLLSDG